MDKPSLERHFYFSCLKESHTDAKINSSIVSSATMLFERRYNYIDK
jgi:hypothetical protein